MIAVSPKVCSGPRASITSAPRRRLDGARYHAEHLVAGLTLGEDGVARGELASFAGVGEDGLQRHLRSVALRTLVVRTFHSPFRPCSLLRHGVGPELLPSLIRSQQHCAQPWR